MRRLATLRFLVIRVGTLVGSAIAIALSPAAHSQIAADPQRAPTLTNARYSEDWSWLADPALRTGRWTEPFKYIPLDENGAPGAFIRDTGPARTIRVVAAAANFRF